MRFYGLFLAIALGTTFGFYCGYWIHNRWPRISPLPMHDRVNSGNISLGSSIDDCLREAPLARDVIWKNGPGTIEFRTYIYVNNVGYFAVYYSRSRPDVEFTAFAAQGWTLEDREKWYFCDEQLFRIYLMTNKEM